MSRRTMAICGGGAAGFFAAITCAEAAPECRVVLLEKTSAFLSKVRVSGGGRSNVTHACFDPRELSSRYPRGGSALLGAFHRFQPRDTIAWFEAHGVKLKTESDGRMFPVTDDSETIVDCLLHAAQRAGVETRANTAAEEVTRREPGGFKLALSTGESMECERLMLTTGGCRTASAGHLAASLGHRIEPPVPSLFAFRLATPWLRELAGISMESVEISVPGSGLREHGAVLVTHDGLSGPAVLRLSAWGARELHRANYSFLLRINWAPHMNEQDLVGHFESCRASQNSRFIANTPLVPIPARLWRQLISAAGVSLQTRWAGLSRSARHQLIRQLAGTELQVNGKSLNKDEFVTCGGVRLSEVSFKTMESRICPGLYFGGELLDIDGLTGGFNFQAAWTTGWIAGHGMSRNDPASNP